MAARRREAHDGEVRVAGDLGGPAHPRDLVLAFDGAHLVQDLGGVDDFEGTMTVERAPGAGPHQRVDHHAVGGAIAPEPVVDARVTGEEVRQPLPELRDRVRDVGAEASGRAPRRRRAHRPRPRARRSRGRTNITTWCSASPGTTTRTLSGSSKPVR